MSCRPRSVDLCRSVIRRHWGRPGDPKFRIPGTKDTGRLQFFYHCPKSLLPVRDILAIQRKGRKTEPHIEKCAENYCQKCVQDYIVGFLRSEEKYLFLLTTCRNASLYNKRFIVGYIRRDRALFCKGHGKSWWSVQGFIKLVSFEEAYLLDHSVGGPHYKTIRRSLLDEGQTAKVLAKLQKGRNILDRCKAEIKRLMSCTDRDS